MVNGQNGFPDIVSVEAFRLRGFIQVFLQQIFPEYSRSYGESLRTAKGRLRRGTLIVDFLELAVKGVVAYEGNQVRKNREIMKTGLGRLESAEGFAA